MIETEQQAERAILIGICYPGQDERETQDYIDELSFLAETAGAVPVKDSSRRLIYKIHELLSDQENL